MAQRDWSFLLEIVLSIFSNPFIMYVPYIIYEGWVIFFIYNVLLQLESALKLCSSFILPVDM